METPLTFSSPSILVSPDPTTNTKLQSPRTARTGKTEKSQTVGQSGLGRRSKSDHGVTNVLEELMTKQTQTSRDQLRETDPLPRQLNYSASMPRSSTRTEKKAGSRVLQNARSAKLPNDKSVGLGDVENGAKSTVSTFHLGLGFRKELESPRSSPRDKRDVELKLSPRVKKQDRDTLGENQPLPWESEIFTKIWPGVPKSEREKTVAELFTTEQAYVRDLLIIQYVWQNPLQKEKLPFKVRPQYITTLFGNIDDIIGINLQFLQNLSTFVDDWDDTKVIGDMLIQAMPNFEAYGNYVSEYDNAIYTFEKLMKQPNIQKWFVNIQTKEPLCKSLNFDAFLIKPVQRVPRYKLFIDRLTNCTPKDHTDYPKLLIALEKCDNIAHVINKAKEKQIQVERMSEIAEQIDFGSEMLMIPGRCFIKDVELDKITRKAKKKTRHLFLFNDLLMVATPPLPGQKHVIKAKLELKGAQVKDQPDDMDNVFLNRFIFLSYPKSLELTAPTKEIKKEWMETLENAIKAADKMTGTGFKVVEVYQRDGEVKSCPICNEKFTHFFRRHHCRQCRRVVCGNCTKHKRKLPSQQEGERKKRVCDQCLLKPAEWKPDNQPDTKDEDSSDEGPPPRPSLPPELSESSCFEEKSDVT